MKGINNTQNTSTLCINNIRVSLVPVTQSIHFLMVNSVKDLAGLYWSKRIDLSKSHVKKKLKTSAKKTNGLLADVNHGKGSSISALSLPAGVAAII